MFFNRSTAIFFFLIFSSLLSFAQSEASKHPQFVVTKQQHPDMCHVGGLEITEGMVHSPKPHEFVDVLLFLQNYDGSWTRKFFTRKGSGPIKMKLSSCNFTGNYYAYAYFSKERPSTLPTSKDVEARHRKRGEKPKFRIAKKSPNPECHQNAPSWFLEQGEVFTPNGEAVEVTLFLQRHDGTWRKKHYSQIGSGFVDLNIQDCTLNGKYRTLVQIISL
ncbi:hypothetical protein [Sediminitomix flava]|uniref:Secreted protein n=1 Tax=Sediminitomix flava TaxID=379075 RepID=A0A315Z5N5_SEDFL|nr:hypothetical protein [Sediminitomix flava]PWJ39218.1 hypothetical protein BC781_106119 [Sediminitomix flava]